MKKKHVLGKPYNTSNMYQKIPFSDIVPNREQYTDNRKFMLFFFSGILYTLVNGILM